MPKLTLAALTAILSSAVIAAQPEWTLSLERHAGGDLKHNDTQIMNFAAGLFYPDWTGTNIRAFDYKKLADETIHGKTTYRDVTFTADLNTKAIDDKTHYLGYTLATQQDVTLNSFHVGFTFPAEILRGRSFQIDEQPPSPFPPELTSTRLAQGNVSRIALDTTHGQIVFAFPQPAHILIQDNRQWSDSFVIRVGADTNDGNPWKAGDSLSFDLDLAMPGPVTVTRPELTVITPGDDWTPLNTVLGIKPDSALDFSKMPYFDAPAGKHGWVKAVGKHFEFENLPGKNQRFYGINFCGNGQVNPHEQATELAERLHRLGYNTVRFHHHENSIILRDKGISTELNPATMDHFDFFFAELKQRGVYCTTDMYVSRRTFASEIWPGEKGDIEMNEFKFLLPVHPAAMANWKTFTRNFLSHKNPYTGLSYAQDPAMAWICMVNEGTLNANVFTLSERLKPLWLDAWNTWLMQKYGSPEKRNQAWNSIKPDAISEFIPAEQSPTEARDFALFLKHKESAMFAEMKAFIRDELGCQALLTDMNFAGLDAWAQLARDDFDYVDSHFYIDHPSFLDQRWRLPSRCANESVVARGTIGGDYSSFTRHFDKPFTITEFNYSGPGRYRGVGGILTGCLGAIQDWAGIWRFAYAHGNSAIFQPAVTNYFDMSRDPLNQAAERATLCLYLRQDMLPAEKSIAITVHPKHLEDHPERPEKSLSPAWKSLVTHAQVGVLIGDNNSTVPADVSIALSDKAPQARKNFPKEAFGEEGLAVLADWMRQDNWLAQGNITDLSLKPAPRQSLNNQLSLSPAQDTMILDTPCTAGAFAPAGTTVITKAATITILDTEATVWASSLDGLPLNQSPHILITHLTDLQNTNTTFAEKERRILLDWGQLPHLVRNGRAKVLIRRAQPGTPKAWVLRTDGERLAALPVTTSPDGVIVELAVKGPDGAQLMYEMLWE